MKLKDRAISAHARVKCPCGDIHRLDELRAVRRPSPSGSEIERWDLQCPKNGKVLAYGSIVMGLYAKSGVEVIDEVYTH